MSEISNEEYGNLWPLVGKLMISFPGSFINNSLEFIAHPKANEYFQLRDCHTDLDIKCKVLEWLSRGCYKTEPFYSEMKNAEFHEFMLKGLNKYLGTSFTEEDMGEIYTYLGNACNHKKTVRFIESGYDLKILNGEDEGRRA